MARFAVMYPNPLSFGEGGFAFGLGLCGPFREGDEDILQPGRDRAQRAQAAAPGGDRLAQAVHDGLCLPGGDAQVQAAIDQLRRLSLVI